MLRRITHPDHSNFLRSRWYSSRLFSASSSTTTNRPTDENNQPYINHLVESITQFTKIEPINTILSKVKFFNEGISRLKADFLNSLHIQEAELSRQHLQRRIRRDYERRRQRLRMHKRHGIHIVDESGREMAFLPSESYTLPSSNRLDNSHHYEISSLTGNYLSTRRPQEHLRQISRDLQTTLPTVAAFLLIPFVGYSFLFLGMMFPRLLLSRQFHTRQQRWDFATTEYGERRAWWGRLNSNFWGTCMRNMPRLIICQYEDSENSDQQYDSFEKKGNNDCSFHDTLSYLEMDAAGPVFSKHSMHTIYNLFHHFSRPNGANSSESPSIQSLQTTHLHALALSNNLAAPILLPSNLSPLFLQTCLPSLYLQQKLTTLAKDIIMDDAALIEEGQLNSECSGMTEEEVLDACWLRGLPLGRFAKMTHTGGCKDAHGREGEVQLMRKVLTNYLQMMKTTMADPLMGYASKNAKGSAMLRSKGELVRDTRLQLLILHLPAIRYSMRTEYHSS